MDAKVHSREVVDGVACSEHAYFNISLAPRAITRRSNISSPGISLGFSQHQRALDAMESAMNPEAVHESVLQKLPRTTCVMLASILFILP